jgi:hypothetical protein
MSVRPLALLLSLAFVAPCLAQEEPDPAPDAPKADDDGDDAPKADDDTEAGDIEDEDAKERERRKEEKRREKELRRNGGRDLDNDSPEAEALDELLSVDARYDKEGTVHLVYDFRKAEQANDWEIQGFDRADKGGPRGKAGRRLKKALGKDGRNALNLTVGSQSKGFMQHRLELKGEFEVTFSCVVSRMTTRSDLVFVVGKGGARFGTQLVKGSRGKFKPVVKGKLDRSAFEDRRTVEVRLVCGSGKVILFCDGRKIDSSTKLEGKLDGRVGIYATDMSLFVAKIEIKGEINKKKL